MFDENWQQSLSTTMNFDPDFVSTVTLLKKAVTWNGLWRFVISGVRYCTILIYKEYHAYQDQMIPECFVGSQWMVFFENSPSIWDCINLNLLQMSKKIYFTQLWQLWIGKKVGFFFYMAMVVKGKPSCGKHWLRH